MSQTKIRPCSVEMFLDKSIDVPLTWRQTKVIPKDQKIENYCKMINEFCIRFKSWFKIFVQNHDLKVLIPWKGLLWASKEPSI